MPFGCVCVTSPKGPKDSANPICLKTSNVNIVFSVLPWILFLLKRVCFFQVYFSLVYLDYQAEILK